MSHRALSEPANAPLAPIRSVGEGARVRSAWIVVLTLLGLAVATLLALRRLNDFPYLLSWTKALHGTRSVIGQTGWTALKVWTFWAGFTTISAGLLLKTDPTLGVFDATLAGSCCLWAFAFVFGNLL